MDLLEKLEIKKTQRVEIQNIKYLKKSKIVNVFLNTDYILPSDLYKNINDKLEELLDLGKECALNIYVSPNNEEYEVNTLINYYHLLLEKNKDLKLLLNEVNIEVEKENQNIIFDINSKYDQKIIEAQIEKIAENLKMYGFKEFSFNFHTKEISEETKEIMEKKIEEVEAKLIEKTSEIKEQKTNLKIFGPDLLNSKIFEIEKITNPENGFKNVLIKGKIYNLELRDLKKSSLLTFMVNDGTSTIICKGFSGFNNRPPLKSDFQKIKIGMEVLVSGKKTYDQYVGDDVIEIEGITIVNSEDVITTREDNLENKRIELHLHSKMSTNNGVSSMDDYAKLAKHFGHEAIAITDHNGVQGFIDAEKAAKKYNLKVIYGVETTVVDKPSVVRNAKDQELEDLVYTVFDLETTGLSANFNKIIEIGAVKICKGEILSRFQSFIKIDEPLKEFTTTLTGITNEDLKRGKDLKDVLIDFKEFYKDTVLVAHNATFDYQFLNKNEIEVLNKSVDVPVLDTLELSRILNPENTFHSLKILTRKYGVQMDSSSHHRADYDSEKLAELFILMLRQIKQDFIDLKTLNSLNETNVNKTKGFHEMIYVKNKEGLPDLYKLVSDAHTKDYLMEPRIRVEDIKNNQDNLLICGSGCIKSKLIDYYLNKTEEELKELINYYDFIEINPKSQYIELVKSDIFNSLSDVEQMHKKLIEIANEVGTKVVASSNAHFINEDLYKIKEILMAKDLRADKVKKDKTTGDSIYVDINKFNKLISDKEEKFKSQFYHTTEEMLLEFSYLEEEVAKEIVIKNPNYLNSLTDELQIVPDDLFTPEIPGVDNKLRDMVYQKAKSIYGEDLPEIIQKRLEKEVNAITKYGFSVIYYISHKLVKHSLDHGYLVGSRGSVGSSLVATFMDITEINPLAPHYVCKKCKKSEFFINGEYASGFDLPDKTCSCGETLVKDGQDIPFETFLGFEGDKVPDIDLNFSGVFQANAHDYVRSKDKLNDDELFDFEHAFRAGTIGTIAEKTAYAYTRNYFELKQNSIRKSDILYFSKECEGIKRTSGQHPGGIIVVPNNLSIYDFTPIQFPANDKSQPWRTTHFDFHSIHDNLLKLDILGHDDPTMLKKLYEFTGIDPKYIDVSDEKIMELFTSTESIGINDELFKLGTLGIPEFGTNFVMEMLLDTKPKSFSELVQISGLSHGTDVWLGNAKNLIDNNVCTLSDVIGCRDDIMVYLMHKGLEDKQAFSIMENVRKGKGLTQEEIKILKEKDIADWYIDSCQKIKYMFPKAHAAAYVLMALRIAYYKVYYPLEYYCAYFSSRIDDFDPVSMIKGEEALEKRLYLVEELDTELSDVKKKNLSNSLKMSLEMVKRGFEFLKFDIEKSEAFEFVIDKENNGLILPFSIIDGLGEKEALNIIEERNKKPFSTKEDLKKRTKIKQKSMEQLEYFNVLEGLQESNQMSLF